MKPKTPSATQPSLACSLVNGVTKSHMMQDRAAQFRVSTLRRRRGERP